MPAATRVMKKQCVLHQVPIRYTVVNRSVPLVYDDIALHAPDMTLTASRCCQLVLTVDLVPDFIVILRDYVVISYVLTFYMNSWRQTSKLLRASHSKRSPSLLIDFCVPPVTLQTETEMK
jgi:hypothetical protein